MFIQKITYINHLNQIFTSIFLRLWDSILADENRFEYLIYVCCAMIILLRDQILENDFEHNVKLLQNFPSTDINFVLNRANQLRDS